jgi:HEAT repeat protein
LSRIGKPAVPALITLFKENDAVCDSARMALKKIGKPAVPILIEALADKPDRIWLRASDALRDIGKDALPALLLARNHPKKEISNKVEIILDTMLYPFRAKEMVPALIELLKEKDERLRIPAAGFLGQFGREARAALPALQEALKDEKSNVVANAAFLLCEFGTLARPAVPALLELLKHKNADVRVTAAKALCQIDGKAATPAVPVLLIVVQHNDFFERQLGRDALLRLPKELLVQALLDGLKSKDPHIRKGAVEFLSSEASGLGAAGHVAIPALIEALKHEDTYSRAVMALHWMRDAATPALIEALKEKNTRNGAAAVLMFTPKAVPDLVKLLQSEDVELRIKSAEILGWIGAPAKEAVPALVEALKEENVALREGAGKALKAIDKEAAAKAGVK